MTTAGSRAALETAPAAGNAADPEHRASPRGSQSATPAAAHQAAYIAAAAASAAEDRAYRSLVAWSKEALVRLATGLAVHRVRSGQDPLGLTASSVATCTAGELAARISRLCREPDTAEMVRIIMQVTAP